jgi:GNAT superfamily N-acetyltransferase
MILLPRTLTVYQLDPARPVATDFGIPGCECKPFLPADIDTYFGQDPQRARTFAGFLQAGYHGLLVHDDRGWAGYAWHSTPASPGPPQLPRWLHPDHPYWLFYAHTREDCRGRGIHKAMLRLRLAGIEALAGRRVPVWSESLAGNIPSRRALLALGFRPMGVLTCLSLTLPFLPPLNLGWWDPDSIHPPLGACPQEAAR